MRVFELDRDGGLLKRAILRQRELGPQWQEGLHVSTICDAICKAIDPKGYSTEIGENQRLAFQELGNAIEDVIAGALAARIPGWVKPEPRQDADGLWGSPDGWR